MTDDMTTDVTPLAGLEVAARRLVRSPVPDGGAGADHLGVVRKVEVDLGDYRRGALSEMGDPDGAAKTTVIGSHYEVEVTQGRTYTFNWARILLDMAESMGESMWNAVTVLRGEYGLKLTIKKPNLERALRTYEVDFVTGRSDGYDDVGDLDRPHILWAWKNPATSIRPRKDES